MMNDAPTLSAKLASRLLDQSNRLVTTALRTSTQQMADAANQMAERFGRGALLSCNARAPHHSPETTAKVLQLAALHLAGKRRGRNQSIKWTFERIADELGLARAQVAGIIWRERRRKMAWRSVAAIDRLRVG
jgi:hypothetical protein